MKAGRWWTITQAVVLLAGILSVASCGNRTTSPDLRVEDLEMILHPSGARILTGTIHNDSKEVVRGAQIQISLFDDKNRRVDAMFAAVHDVPAGGSVDFREPVQSEYDVRGARVRSILIVTP